MKIVRRLLICVAVGLVLSCIAIARGPRLNNTGNTIPQSFRELIHLSDEELEKVGIARMNLLCAQGLPGSEELNIDQCLQQFDIWARHVKLMEQRYMPAFYQNRGKYRNSPALFKGVYLGLAIEKDFNCKYNEDLEASGAMDDRASTSFFRDSSDIFINGLILDGRGTCSSLHVLMVALGRRCGYPMHLVACGGHLFCRWDDGNEKMNLEITCEGVTPYPDEHYLNWPRKLSDAEIVRERLM